MASPGREGFEASLAELSASAPALIAGADGLPALEAARVSLLGRKGRLTLLLKSLKDLDLEDRKRLGPEANGLKGRIEASLDEKLGALQGAALEKELDSFRLDLSLPGSPCPRGRRHPLVQTADEMAEILRRLGFSWAEGPHVESDHYNFWALNFPPDHPAMDAHDTFYVKAAPGRTLLLRTHTSPVQIRTLEAQRPPKPVRIISPGRVFRHENADASHSAVFHQIEGLCVDRGVTMADLKGTLRLFLEGLFGPGTRMRLRPSFFPFTEPSAQVDIQCTLCQGAGCPVCKRLGWLEILGAGMVHPNVLRGAGYDPEVWSGYAWGLGVERVAMLKKQVKDIRLFYQNDLRFLEQWS
ncbi:MAG TPA: phenylalanine--tRNA ligase subunit alpha [Elusimicrobia bacterium]|nr:phenylalanine--tRNA ligase subunit alpha [Elusimicrobiota bacterium]